MIREALSHFSQIPLAVAGMLLFMLTFLVASIRAYLDTRPSEDSERHARLPLSEDSL